MKEAIEIIEKVFPKCYDDLEPIGRRIRRNSDDMLKAFKEASYYGYEQGSLLIIMQNTYIDSVIYVQSYTQDQIVTKIKQLRNDLK